MALSAGTRLGPYEILEPLGAGGMGEVYRARDTRLGRTVAVKVLPAGVADDPQLKARFEREARAIAALAHPNICTLHDVGEKDGRAFLVMEHLVGRTLAERLKEGPLSVAQALKVVTEIAGALAAAHEQGIVHRDVKPGNVMLTKTGARLLDFGLAQITTREERSSVRSLTSAPTEQAALTQLGIILGTMPYMAPEQVEGRPADARSDIWALGVVLYEMLTGRRPFQGDSKARLAAAILEHEPPQLSSLDPQLAPGLEHLVGRCLAKAPDARWPTARDVANQLEEISGRGAAVARKTLAEPEIKSIVVLPFRNLSPDPDQEYFSDGLTEELIADLSKVRSLRVISRTSAMLLKGSKKDVPAIARDLNVRYVLEGSVRWAGKSLRITAQLIEAATDAHLWADKYTGTLEDVFDLQEQLSRRIVEALKVTLTPDEDRHLASRDIPDAEAYALYIRARQELAKLTEESFDLAEQLLERALARTGPNALLLATAAEIAYSFQDMGYRPAAETLDRGDALATRALELNPSLAEAHVAKGLIAQRHFDAPASVRHIQRAVDLDPADAMAAWAAGFLLAEVGRTDEARVHGDRARALDPLFWPAPFGSALADLCDGNFESALAKIVRMHTISGDNPVASLWLGVSLIYAGRSDEAAAPLDEAAAAGAGIFSATAAVFVAMLSGDREAMRAVLADPGTREALEMTTELTWMVAAASASVGDLEEALHWLSRAIEMGFVNHRFFAEHDPLLAKLRGDPRFEALMERAREKRREIEAEA